MYNRKAVDGSAEWYYIGHYGQLGPLTRDQIDELITGGVIAKDTYVWKTGMSDWLHADHAQELRDSFATTDPFLMPPPPPSSSRPSVPSSPPVTQTMNAPYGNPTFGSWRQDTLAPTSTNYPAFGTIKSDRSRVLAGVLNLFLPGVGRIYLGHMAHGVLQLVLSLCFGVGWLWSFIDGIIILSGGVKYDGYGRVLTD